MRDSHCVRGLPGACVLLVAAFASAATAGASASSQLIWFRLPDIPDPHGLAGPCVGVHEDALIVAGGANFPDGVPWHPAPGGGKSVKHYHDAIYVLSKNSAGTALRASDGRPIDDETRYRWMKASARLPRGIAYGVSVSTPQGVLSIGGEWQTHEATANGELVSTTHRSQDVYVLRYDPRRRQVTTSRTWVVHRGGRQQQIVLPRLPVGITAACGGLVGNNVYIAGGDTGQGGSRDFWRLDLKGGPGPDWKWESLDPWSGPPRTHAIAVSQAGSLWLLSGRSNLEGEGFRTHADAHRYDPATGWTKVADIAPDGMPPRCVMAGTGYALGQGRLCVFGGARGEVLLRRERDIPIAIEKARAADDANRVVELKREAVRLYDEHHGFSRDVLCYDVAKEAWSTAGEMPVPGPVTTTAVRSGATRS